MSCARSPRTIAAVLFLATAVSATAAELKVISAGAVRGVIGGMIDEYSKETGHKFEFTTGPTGFLRDTIASSKPADLIIASSP
jgi:ABC-type molybdate transport system substrate-binding protein